MSTEPIHDSTERDALLAQVKRLNHKRHLETEEHGELIRLHNDVKAELRRMTEMRDKAGKLYHDAKAERDALNKRLEHRQDLMRLKDERIAELEAERD